MAKSISRAAAEQARKQRLKQRSEYKKRTEISIQKLAYKAFKKARSEGKTRAQAEFAAKIKESRVKTGLRESIPKKITVGTSRGAEFAAKISPTGEVRSKAFDTESQKLIRKIQQERAIEESQPFTKAPSSQIERLERERFSRQFSEFERETLSSPNVQGLAPTDLKAVGVKPATRKEAARLSQLRKQELDEAPLRKLEAKRITASEKARLAKIEGGLVGTLKSESFGAEAKALEIQLKGGSAPKEILLRPSAPNKGKILDVVESGALVFGGGVRLAKGKRPTEKQFLAVDSFKEARDFRSSLLLAKSSQLEKATFIIEQPKKVAKVFAESAIISGGVGLALGGLTGTAVNTVVVPIVAVGATVFGAVQVGKAAETIKGIDDPFQRGRARSQTQVNVVSGITGGTLGGVGGFKAGQRLGLSVETSKPSFKKLLDITDKGKRITVEQLTVKKTVKNIFGKTITTADKKFLVTFDEPNVKITSFTGKTKVFGGTEIKVTGIEKGGIGLTSKKGFFTGKKGQSTGLLKTKFLIEEVAVSPAQKASQVNAFIDSETALRTGSKSIPIALIGQPTASKEIISPTKAQKPLQVPTFKSAVLQGQKSDVTLRETQLTNLGLDTGVIPKTGLGLNVGVVGKQKQITEPTSVVSTKLITDTVLVPAAGKFSLDIGSSFIGKKKKGKKGRQKKALTPTLTGIKLGIKGVSRGAKLTGIGIRGV